MLEIKTKQTIVIIQIINMSLLFVLYLLTVGNEISIEFSKKILLYYFFYHSLWAMYSWYLIDNDLFNPYILFLFAAIIFNGGQFILQLFGITFPIIMRNKFSIEEIYYTILFTSFGLSAFHLGALVSLKKNKRNYFYDNNPFNSEKSILWVGIFLFIISIIPAIYVLKNSLNIVLSVGYFGLFQTKKVTGIASAPTILANFLTPATIFILAGGRKHKQYVLFSLIIIFFLTVLRFFLGDRSGAVMPLLGYIWVWHKVYRPIPTATLLLSGSFLLFFIFPLVSLTRNLSGAYRMDISFLKNAFLTINNPAIAILYEMGSTAETVGHTLSLVPAIKDFEWGRTYFYGLYSLIPNFFADIHPAKAYGAPTYWLIWHVSSFTAKRGGSLGYSFIAEAYLNFNWIGGIIHLFIFGYLLGRLTSFAKSTKNIGRIVFLGSFFAFLIKYARADIQSVLRPMLWYALIPTLLIYVHFYLTNFTKDYFLIKGKND